MSQLFSSYALGSLQLKNRIVIAPMCQYSANNGEASHWHLMHLGQMATSGAGLLILEATAVSPEGRISPQDLGLWSDATEEALARTIQAIRQYSQMPIGIQLAHAGRKASSHTPWNGGQLMLPADGGWQTVAPSAIPHLPTEPAPLELNAADLERLLNAFAESAKRAVRIGLNAIEVHAAHGYLLHQFLSPLANQRTDNYGGSLENRMRFPLQVVAAIQAAVPKGFPVGLRLSATDWVDGGWDLPQSIAFCQALTDMGTSFLHVSSGGLSSQQKIPLAPNYQVGFAQAVRKATGLPTIAVGLITEAAQAEAIIASGQADCVALARGMLFNPHWPWQAAADLQAQVEVPPQYWRSQPRDLKALFGDARMGQR